MEFLGQIASATNRRGIFVYDREGDEDNMFRFYIDHGYNFIVSLWQNTWRKYRGRGLKFQSFSIMLLQMGLDGSLCDTANGAQ